MTSLPVRLNPSDRSALLAHFLSLDAEDRRLRFGASVGDHALEDYVARLDFERDGLFAVQDDELQVLAVVHVACLTQPAELGLSVLPAWRRSGAGSSLFRRAVTFLRNRGVERVFMHCLTENAAILHIARKNGMRLLFGEGASQAHLELPAATYDSYVGEWLEDQQARTVQALRLQARVTRVLFSTLAARVP